MFSWSPSEGLQHGGRKLVETSHASLLGSLKTFLLSVKHLHRYFSQHIGYSELET